MGSLAQFASELKSWFSSLDPLACPTLVARAWQDIRKAREWSFLKQTGCVFAPSIITTGTVRVTQFSTQIVADATAAPFWNAVAITQAPAYPLTLRQFRVTGGPIYNIIGWDGTNTATLDRPYAETSASGGSYMIYHTATGPLPQWTSRGGFQSLIRRTLTASDIATYTGLKKRLTEEIQEDLVTRYRLLWRLMTM